MNNQHRNKQNTIKQSTRAHTVDRQAAPGLEGPALDHLVAASVQGPSAHLGQAGTSPSVR